MKENKIGFSQFAAAAAVSAFSPISRMLPKAVLETAGRACWTVPLLCFLPLLGFCFALKLLGFEELVLPALMVLAMPCGMNTIVFPKLVGEDCKPGAALAFITTILCIVTIPICLFVLGIPLG